MFFEGDVWRGGDLVTPMVEKEVPASKTVARKTDSFLWKATALRRDRGVLERDL